MKKIVLKNVIAFAAAAMLTCGLVQGQTTGLSGTGANTQNAGTTGTECTFVGPSAGFSNSTGASNSEFGFKAGYNNATGSYNTIHGYEAGLGVASNNYSYNTFMGYRSGRATTTGTKNVFVGANTGLGSTTATYGTFVGYNSGVGNTTGLHNTYLGYSSGYTGTTGNYNTILGSQAGTSSTTASDNTFVGLNAGYANTTGNANTAVGNYAGDTYATGTNNSFFGYEADANGNYTNATALGNGAIVNASNKIRLGNTAVTVIEGQVAYTFPSDGRFKFNVNEEVKGLDFITKLRPVNYQFDTKSFDQFLHSDMVQAQDSNGTMRNSIDYGPSTAMIHTGFIAQEVEKAAAEARYVSDIVHTPDNEHDNYSVSYAGFVVPLVKAVQEQQVMIAQLTEEVKQLKAAGNTSLPVDPALDKAQAQVIQTELRSDANTVLYQNEPNPVSGKTAIRFFLPANATNAMLVFHNEFGTEIQKIELTTTGFGRVEAATEQLASGIYTYSLIVNGKVIDTKKMVKSN